MIYPRQPTNTKVCPGCSTRLINTATRCLVCGYIYPEEEAGAAHKSAAQPQAAFRLQQTLEPQRPRKTLQVTVSLPLLGLVILLLLGLNTAAILGWQQREVTKTQVAGSNATSTFIATTYVSPTPTVTVTFTVAPPTFTVEPIIEYSAVEGDSCLAIATRFKVSLDDLLAANREIDCGLLSIGTVFIIPRAPAVPEPAGTQTPEP